MSTQMDSAAAQVKSDHTMVGVRIVDTGTYYKAGNLELGPYAVHDEQDPNFDLDLAKELNVEPRYVVTARLQETCRPTTFEEIGEILGSTVRRDLSTKLILFSADILTLTDEDQINILMSGESSIGKTYVALEVASYFPKEIVTIVASASPTAFFHERGEWDDNQKVLRVNLKGMILILLDQPHYMLLERLRPLLSHDRRELLYKITDKSEKKGLRTKNVILVGYPTVIFCAAKLTLDEQERTRVFILSPETSNEKLEDTLRLIISKSGNREAFREWIETHPRRRWLKNRILDIKNSGVKNIVIPDQEAAYEMFKQSHTRLAPRHQRDIVRILALVKAHALLNHRHRKLVNETTIESNKDDLEAGFKLYSLIAEPNELGLSPQVYEMYHEVILPLLDAKGIDRKTILKRYHKVFSRNLVDARLRREILPAIESAGLIVQDVDPEDKRRTLVYPPDTALISTNEENRGVISGVDSWTENPPRIHPEVPRY